MNVEIGTEAAQFPAKEYLNGIFIAVHSVSSELANSLAKIQFVLGALVHKKSNDT
jgi:hypothetical protein